MNIHCNQTTIMRMFENWLIVIRRSAKLLGRLDFFLDLYWISSRFLFGVLFYFFWISSMGMMAMQDPLMLSKALQLGWISS